jgi:D-cysteine desulfhydrase
MRLEIDLDRVRLGEGPTPVRELTHLGSERGQAPVWIKDDGAYSSLGGNKVRKLEWLLAAARRRGARTVLTGGALGTNHGLATARVAGRLGMRTVLVLVPQPQSDHVRRQLERLRESGAELHFPRGRWRAYALSALLLARDTDLPLRPPYPLLPGGSVPRGCVGYVLASFELADQIAAGELPAPSHVVAPVGSGGTVAGLLAGLKLAGLGSRPVGVLVNDLTPMSERKVARLSRRTIALLRRHGADISSPAVSAADLDLERGALGEGYGHPTPEGHRATALLRERERVTLDPTYTAKAMGALLELNRRGAFGAGPVLFWHTYTDPEAWTGSEAADRAVPDDASPSASRLRRPGPRGRRRRPEVPETEPRSRR